MNDNLTDRIFELTAPYDNPYQGLDKKLLFVCSAGILRSATAANLFAKKGYNTRSCGSHEYALIPFSTNLLMWADKIYFVNRENYNTVFHKWQNYNELINKSKILDIPDSYEYNNQELLSIFERTVEVNE